MCFKFLFFIAQTTSASFTSAPLTIFYVEPGKRYRFRFINSGFNICPIIFQIEKHEMQIIASELSYVEPLNIDSLYSVTGERFDFVIDANRDPGDYWIRIKTLQPCQITVEGFAVLRYGTKSGSGIEFVKKDPPHYSEDFPEEKLFNSPLPKVKDIPFLRLNAYEYDESIIYGDPDFKFFLFLHTPNMKDEVLYKRGNTYRFSCEL
jgi:Multicopper oxidase